MKKIKEYLWAIELLIAISGLLLSFFAYQIAYPEYKEFKEKNNIQDINGNWEIHFITEETNFSAYKGDTNTYRMFLLGSKDQYKGKGERVKINGELIDSHVRDRLEIDIILKKDKIHGLYYLYGKKRDTDGNFSVKLSSDGSSFSGTFIGNAADSSGIVKGVKKE